MLRETPLLSFLLYLVDGWYKILVLSFRVLFLLRLKIHGQKRYNLHCPPCLFDNLRFKIYGQKWYSLHGPTFFFFLSFDSIQANLLIK